jgi:NADH-quinone oxidoreductase subunit J
MTQWVLFSLLSAVAIPCAAAMLLTMSMYRAGLYLMSSFVALAGLFLLLDANLLAAIQIMMNVGGMMVMVLFMVMMMMDPGGSMMWKMKRDMGMSGPGALSMRMPKGPQPKDPKHREHHQMMVDMAMSTTQRPWALGIGAACVVGLGALVILTAWPLAVRGPEADASVQVGHLLLSKYMLAFEGAAFLILAGIAGAVVLGKHEGAPMVFVKEAEQATGDFHTCPMHPEVQQPGPGTCPKCGMKLVKKESKT